MRVSHPFYSSSKTSLKTACPTPRQCKNGQRRKRPFLELDLLKNPASIKFYRRSCNKSYSVCISSQPSNTR